MLILNSETRLYYTYIIMGAGLDGMNIHIAASSPHHEVRTYVFVSGSYTSFALARAPHEELRPHQGLVAASRYNCTCSYAARSALLIAGVNSDA